MRLNRGTISLLAVLLVVIIAVLVINNQQASAPGETATPETVTGALLPGVAAENIVRIEVRDNNSGSFTALTKDSGGAWEIESTSALANRDPEQSLIETTTGQIVAINYSNTFAANDLPNFGLDSPDYSVFVSTSDGQFYTIYVGNKQPTGPRYYTVVEQSSVPTTPESPEESNAVATMDIESENDNEGGVMPPNAEVTDEATAEATERVASKPAQQADPTASPEGGAVATMEIEGENENEGGVAADPDATIEATIEVTMEATAEATPNPAADPIDNPRVTLEGEQTIYLIPQTVIDTLKRWLTAPPYAPVPTPEAVGVEGTIQAPPVLEEGASGDLVDVEPAVTQQATNEATPEATAES